MLVKAIANFDMSCPEYGRSRLFLAGEIFAITLVHGLPLPHFLSQQVFECLIQNPSKQKGTIEDIYDSEVKSLLESL